MQVQQQHPLHSHMCKPIDAPSSFKVLLLRSTVVNPRNERLETQNTKGFKKGRQEGLQQSEHHHHHQQQKQHRNLQNPNFKEDTFHQQNAKPKENRENIRVWVGGGEKGREEEDARKNCKRRRSLELTHLCFESKFHNNNNTHCIHSQKCTSRHHLMIVFSSTSL